MSLDLVFKDLKISHRIALTIALFKCCSQLARAETETQNQYLDLAQLTKSGRYPGVVIKTKFETMVVLRVAKIYTIGTPNAHVEYSTSKSYLLLQRGEEAVEDAGITLKDSNKYTWTAPAEYIQDLEQDQEEKREESVGGLEKRNVPNHNSGLIWAESPTATKTTEDDATNDDQRASSEVSSADSEAETEIESNERKKCLEWMSKEVQKEMIRRSGLKRRQSWCIGDARTVTN